MLGNSAPERRVRQPYHSALRATRHALFKVIRRTPKDAAEILRVARPAIMRREGQIMCRATSAQAAFTSRTSARAAAGVALHAGAVAHQGEVAALAAGVAFIAFQARFADLFGAGVEGAH